MLTKRQVVLALALAIGVMGYVFISDRIDDVHRATETRKLNALLVKYAPSEVQIIQNDAFADDRQFCFVFELISPSGARVRKVAMVVGDSDGGVFKVNREFDTLHHCVDNYSAG